MEKTSKKDVELLKRVIRDFGGMRAYNMVKNYEALYNIIMKGKVYPSIYKFKHLGVSVINFFDEETGGPEKIFLTFKNRLLVFLPCEDEFKQVDSDTYELKEIYLLDDNIINKMKLLGLKELSDSSINKLLSQGSLTELMKINSGKLYVRGQYHADL